MSGGSGDKVFKKWILTANVTVGAWFRVNVDMKEKQPKKRILTVTVGAWFESTWACRTNNQGC